ncbi:FHA domain-containing protein [Solirubrobacter ginsenosidimutans]|uniref:FHA domain-containing protein n=1 Tax=Solirubrobacter ginsenosidimutans TaxID=490573 RepID=A0A9X3S8G6_9ACTN|nr:FHA domain-containing protein [Solirubrobacter ginsenosidimutans]MDA0166981.1 FHA domain-containing protein [Solirubrobacter ginsenosidimutans]
MQWPLHQATPAELKARLEAERSESAFLILRDGSGAQRIVPLDPGQAPVTIGRASTAGIRLPWDHEVSRLHAELDCLDGHWTLSDNGLSRNGTFLNGARVKGRKRLQDGDALVVGATRLAFRSPPGSEATSAPTVTPAGADERPPISEAELRVAVLLCRPFAGADTFATPMTNQDIAGELMISVAAVKTHLRALFRRFGIEDLPQNEKRVRLVELLLRSGVVGERER